MIKRPLLLVSVRSAEEALSALEGGADIIDVKEPSRGPLGAADASTLQSIAAAVAHRKPLSAALGELLAATKPPLSALGEFSWLKFGSAQSANCENWPEAWAHFTCEFERPRQLVAAAYADFAAAQSLSPRQLAAHFDDKCEVFLLDTFKKQGNSVFDFCSLDELRALQSQVRMRRAQFALAGSLQVKHLDQVMQLAPDIVGIRGAACVDGREGRICAKMVREFQESLQRAANASQSAMQATA